MLKLQFFHHFWHTDYKGFGKWSNKKNGSQFCSIYTIYSTYMRIISCKLYIYSWMKIIFELEKIKKKLNWPEVSWWRKRFNNKSSFLSLFCQFEGCVAVGSQLRRNTYGDKQFRLAEFKWMYLIKVNCGGDIEFREN